ncbi:MAG TPA: hypothetical protein PLX89_03915 [Verrucomicrobiota bacterium]|nr:hypothetical protein [Verrucomicrobiota bacterium]
MPASRHRQLQLWFASFVAFGAALWAAGADTVPPAGFAPSTNRPRAEVIAVHDPAATRHFLPNAAIVRRMVERGLTALADKPTLSDAWRALLRTNDVVGFKVNSAPGDISGTRPVVVRALIETLLESGHSPRRIVIWDKRSTDLRGAGWYALADELGVRCVASEDAGWDPDQSKSYEKSVLGRLTASDLEFGRKDELNAGRRSYVTTLLTKELTVVIPVTPVLTHNLAGVSGQLTGLAFASVDNTLRFANNGPLIAEAVPEICALDDVLPRVVFGVSDALIAQYRGEESVRLHNTVILNELRFSRDSVALDALALDDLERARQGPQKAMDKPGSAEVYVNAELLELGVSDLKRIDVRRLE